MLDVKVNPQGPQEPNPNVQAIRTSILLSVVCALAVGSAARPAAAQRTSDEQIQQLIRELKARAELVA